MNDDQVFAFGGRDLDSRRGLGQRLGREKYKRQVGDGFAEFGTVCAVPRADRVERFEQSAFCAFDYTNEVEAGVSDGSGAVGEADEGERDARGPYFRVISFGGFQRGEREDDVTYGSGAD